MPRSVTTRQLRTRTFSGCQSCRRRRVKCGEERPTCKNCRRLAIRCHGYQVNLDWRSVVTGDPDIHQAAAESSSNQSRRNLFSIQQREAMIRQLLQPFSKRTWRDDLDDAIEDLDNAASYRATEAHIGITRVIGPFASFRVKAQLEADVRLQSRDKIQGRSEGQTEPGGFESCGHDIFLRHDSGTTVSSLQPPSDSRFLLDHYTTYLVHLLLPMPVDPSPWQIQFLPCCLRTLEVDPHTEPPSQLEFAVLFGVLACAALHAQKVFFDPDSGHQVDRWHGLGLHCKDKALALIQQELHCNTAGHQLQEKCTQIVMVLLSLRQMCSISGATGDGHWYLELANLVAMVMMADGRHQSGSEISAILSTVGYMWTISSACATLTATERCASQLSTPTSTPSRGCLLGYLSRLDFQTTSFRVTEQSYFSHIALVTDPTLLELHYGVSLSVLQLLNEITALAKVCYSFRTSTENNALSPAFVRQASLLENKLLVHPHLSVTQRPQPSGQLVTDADLHPILTFHLGRAFHCAVALLFQRTIRNTHPVLLQSLVRRTLTHLARAEEHKAQNSIDAGFAMFSVFVAGCEALPSPAPLPIDNGLKTGLSDNHGDNDRESQDEDEGEHESGHSSAGDRGKRERHSRRRALAYLSRAARCGIGVAADAERIMRREWAARDQFLKKGGGRDITGFIYTEGESPMLAAAASAPAAANMGDVIRHRDRTKIGDSEERDGLQENEDGTAGNDPELNMPVFLS